eukprot:INCI10403.1.p1 GENE.INCI10403.1~~INCI10403.1.p1  ORF type:complete len:681 (+),score=51.79 INCI10403.1:815-2857(+)
MSAASLRPTTYAAVVRSDEGGGAIRERSSNGDGNTGHGHSHGRELEFEFESTHQPPAAVDGVGDRFGFSAASAQNNTRGEGPSFPMGGRARHRRLMEVKKRTSVVARSAKVRCAVIGAVTAAVFVAVVVVLAVLVPRADESGPLLFVTTSSSSLPASSTSTTGVLWTRSSNGSGPGSTVSHASTTSVPAASLPESGLEAATGQFLHFSDFHLDLLYDSAYNASCFCNKPEHKIIDSTNVWTTTGTVASSAVDSQCRVLYDQGVVGSHSSPMTTAEELATQVVGRHGCDSSEALVNKTLQHAYDMLPNPDFILVTGDYVRHYTDDLLGGGPARIPVILRTIERVGELIQAFFPAVVTHHAVEPYYELGNLSYRTVANGIPVAGESCTCFFPLLAGESIGHVSCRWVLLQRSGSRTSRDQLEHCYLFSPSPTFECNFCGPLRAVCMAEANPAGAGIADQHRRRSYNLGFWYFQGSPTAGIGGRSDCWGQPCQCRCLHCWPHPADCGSVQFHVTVGGTLRRPVLCDCGRFPRHRSRATVWPCPLQHFSAAPHAAVRTSSSCVRHDCDHADLPEQPWFPSVGVRCGRRAKWTGRFPWAAFSVDCRPVWDPAQFHRVRAVVDSSRACCNHHRQPRSHRSCPGQQCVRAGPGGADREDPVERFSVGGVRGPAVVEWRGRRDCRGRS